MLLSFCLLAEREMSRSTFHFPEWRSNDSTERFTSVGVHVLESLGGFGWRANRRKRKKEEKEKEKKGAIS